MYNKSHNDRFHWPPFVIRLMTCCDRVHMVSIRQNSCWVVHFCLFNEKHYVVASDNVAAKQNTHIASARLDPSSELPWLPETLLSKVCFSPDELLLARGLLWKRPCSLLVVKLFRLPSSRYAICADGISDVTFCIIWTPEQYSLSIICTVLSISPGSGIRSALRTIVCELADQLRLLRLHSIAVSQDASSD